jgi:hypothetical protein
MPRAATSSRNVSGVQKVHTSVTATFASVPLDDAIQRLSRWHSVVLIYKGSTEGVGAPVLTEAWVTRSSPDLAKANPRGLEPPARDTSRDARADARLPAEWEQAAKALIAFKDANPETRSQQIEALVRAQGEDAIVAALREVATRNPDPRVRRSAIQVLGSMGSPQALAAVQATLSDANASVRSEALTHRGLLVGRPRFRSSAAALSSVAWPSGEGIFLTRRLCAPPSRAVSPCRREVFSAEAWAANVPTLLAEPPAEERRESC